MMKSSRWMLVIVLALALGAGSAMGALVAGQSVGIDFDDGGATPGSGTEVNFNVFADNANATIGVGSVIDTSGALVSDVSIISTNWARGNPGMMGEGDIGYGVAGNDYTGSPFSDLSFNDGIWHTPDSQTDWPMGTVTFTGLDDGLSYNLQVVGGRVTGSPGFTVDAGGQSVSKTFADIRNGTGPISPLEMTGLTTDGSGNLEVTIHDPTEYIGVNALHLTAVPIETLALLHPGVTSATPTSAVVHVSINTNADQVVVYWGAEDQGATNSGWTGSSDLGPWTGGAGQVSATIDGLMPDTSYAFRFAASNLAGLAWSDAGSVATDFETDQAPSNLAATPVSYTVVALDWDEGFETETGFLLRRAEDLGFTTGIQDFTLGANLTNYIDSTVAPDSTNYYKVAALNDHGQSVFSDPAMAITEPEPPPSEGIGVGQSIGVDFDDGGNTAGSGSEVNFNVFADNANTNIPAGSVIDTDGIVVNGLSITGADWNRAGGMMGENNIGYGVTGNDYSGSPFSDLSFNDGCWELPETHGEQTGPASITFSGLNDGLLYDLLVVGGRLAGEPDMTVNADGQSVTKTFADIRNDSGPIAPMEVTGLKTDGSGNLVVTFTDDGYFGVNALHLTAVGSDAVVITDMQINAGQLELSWVSSAGFSYDVQYSWDLVADDWTDLVVDLPTTPPTNVYGGVYAPTVGAEHYRVVANELPPLFLEDFEGGAAGWFETNTTGTAWEFGTPAFSGNVDITNAYSGVNCWGTGLATPYADNSITYLHSPTIDLTGVTNATLEFAQARDIEGLYLDVTTDAGEVNILDPVSGTVLAARIMGNYETTDTDQYYPGKVVNLTSPNWVTLAVDLPAAALDREIVIQFRFGSEVYNLNPQGGWYIDDVSIK